MADFHKDSKKYISDYLLNLKSLLQSTEVTKLPCKMVVILYHGQNIFFPLMLLLEMTYLF